MNEILLDSLGTDYVDSLGKDRMVVRMADGFSYVTVNSMCDAFKIGRRAQRQKLQRYGDDQRSF